ncbi:hypothetical protein [Ornithinimicrobium sp. INDO-MA30-4]|uniref:hypothetical protein n=1 Tax=Ornithinimicrobium sp. INDO-MA30-4 TaxID=2908651 RepID=UPI001F36276F|nr:hypothetical protein [Ornithinimicrobium sp. INDO-MA30-4]UJH70677.1 hypothetical protein L0A91_00855 [Ornithinimicrobium sp. INDO-MA30-4]
MVEATLNQEFFTLEPVPGAQAELPDAPFEKVPALAPLANESVASSDAADETSEADQPTSE